MRNFGDKNGGNEAHETRQLSQQSSFLGRPLELTQLGHSLRISRTMVEICIRMQDKGRETWKDSVADARRRHSSESCHAAYILIKVSPLKCGLNTSVRLVSWIGVSFEEENRLISWIKVLGTACVHWFLWLSR